MHYHALFVVFFVVTMIDICNYSTVHLRLLSGRCKTILHILETICPLWGQVTSGLSKIVECAGFVESRKNDWILPNCIYTLHVEVAHSSAETICRELFGFTAY